MLLVQIIKREEGFRKKPYLCSEGYVTVGFGTKLHVSKGLNPSDFPVEFTEEIAIQFLNEEVIKIEASFNRLSIGNTYRKQNLERRAVLVSMAYQMGVNGLVKFRKMWKALEVGDYIEAHDQALDSRWAKQTSARANRHAQVLAGVQVY